VAMTAQSLALCSEPQRLSSNRLRMHTPRRSTPHRCLQTKPKLAIYSHLILFGASADDVVAATQKVYNGRVEMGTDLTVIEVGDSINIRRPKRVSSAVPHGIELAAAIVLPCNSPFGTGWIATRSGCNHREHVRGPRSSV